MISFLVGASLSMIMGEPAVARLEAPMPVHDVAVADLNDDGVEDVIALCAKNGNGGIKKSVTVFLSDGSGFSPTPLTTTLPDESGPAFIARCESDAPQSFILRTFEGAEIYDWTGSGFKRKGVTPIDSILPVHVREPKFLTKASYDFDGDGVDEWLLPAVQGFSIYSPEGKLYDVRCDTISEMRPSQTGAMQISHSIPAIHMFTLPDNGGNAIAFLTDEYADFAYGEEFKNHTRFKVPVNVDDKWDTFAQLHDITNNGLPDLIVTQTQGTINLNVLTQIYFAKEPFTYSQVPDAAFETKGSFAMPMVADVNGDEYADLITVKVPFGITFFTNLLLRNKVKIKVEAHTFRDGGFDEDPELESGVTIGAPDGREQNAYTLGDFDNDGRMDVAIGTGGDQLRIHRGIPGELMDNDAWVELDISAIGSARTVDLNHEGGDDLIVIHPGGDQSELIEVAIFN